MNTSDTMVAQVKRREVWLALRNGIKLVVSLVITLGIAFTVRFWMPGFLGPEAFGVLTFAEGFAMMFFILATLGAEAYIRKEVAVRTEHASEFFGVLLLFQTAVSVVLVGAATAIMFGLGKDAQVFRLVYLFSAGQFFFVTNAKFNSLLQAKGNVNELAILNTVSKFLWGAGIIVGLIVWKRLEIVGAMFLFTELIKTPVLYRASRKYLDLRLNLDWKVGKVMLLASFPYFLNSMAHTIASKVDVFMLAELANDKEVGWYGAAANINYVVLLAMPVIIAVVTPMSARIAAEGEDGLNETMRSIVRLTSILTIPMALLVALSAEDIIITAFSAEYSPSITSARILSPNVPLVFICTILAIQLIQLEKIWQVAKISIISLALNPILNAFVIVPAHKWLGDGGAGLAAATTTLITSIVVTVLMFMELKSAAADKRTLFLFVRFSVLIAIFIGIHKALAFVGLWRGPIEVLLYPVVAIPLGVLPLKEIIRRGKLFLASRKKRS